MSVPFEFVIGGPAVSQQTRRAERRELWKEEVRSAARDRWTAGLPVAGSVAVTITYFFDGDEPDVDNVPKPILDAMKGLVYSDDAQVFDLLCRKRDLTTDLLIRNPSTDLLGYLRESRQVVHIFVEEASNLEVAF